jgi:predicted histone-like DNA-binding protein
MTVLYQVSPVKSHLNEDGQTKYLARATKRKKADLTMISRMMSKRSTLNAADITAVLVSLAEIVPELLLDNYTVHLPPLGIFSLSIKSEVLNTPEEVNRSSIKEAKIQFLPDKAIVNELKGVELEKV